MDTEAISLLRVHRFNIKLCVKCRKYRVDKESSYLLGLRNIYFECLFTHILKLNEALLTLLSSCCKCSLSVQSYVDTDSF